MSRFELHISGIDQALSELYKVKKTLNGSISSVSSSSRLLAGQKTAIALSAYQAIIRQRSALINQLTATDNSLITLKQIKNDVRLAEIKACYGGAPIDFVRAAYLFYDAGWTKSMGRAFSALEGIKEFSLLHGNKDIKGGLVNLSGDVGKFEAKGKT